VKAIRMLFALLGATILLGALVGAASARNFSVSNQSLRGTFSSVEIEGGAWGIVRCRITVEGSFHSRTAAKVLGTLMGYITRVALGPCATGTATALTETLPWHVKYSGFQGGLPQINSIIAHIIGSSWRVREAGGINCLGRSTASEPSIAIFHRSTATHEITEAGISGRIRTGSECFGIAGTFHSDSGSVTLLGSTTRITLSLI